MARVSVLIPVFNGATVLARAVGCALAQTLSDLEVIVIDDASTDDSLTVAQRLSDADPRVRIVAAAENGGPGAARALGLHEAQGEWVAILDADDSWASDRLERLIDIADRWRFDVVADNLALIDPGLGSVVGLAFPLEPDAIEVLTPERFLANCIPGGKVNLGWMKPLVRRKFLLSNDVSWHPLRHAEDMVVTMELLLAGAHFGLVGWPGYHYTQRRGTVSGRRSSLSRAQRSALEQQRAVALIRGSRHTIAPEIDRRLARMHHEIVVTTRVLQARDAIEAGRWLAAAGHLLGALARPSALRSCMAARYGPRSDRIV